MAPLERTRKETLEQLLKHACLVTGAAWAVWADRESGVWQVIAAHEVRKTALRDLNTYLQQTAIDAWMCGAFSSHALRSHTFPIKGLSARRAVLFPVPGAFLAFLVGGELSPDHRRLWRSLAEALSISSSEEKDDSLSRLQEKLLGDLPEAVGNLFEEVIRITQATGGWLAVHRAERLEIRYRHNCPEAQGKVLSPEEEPLVYHLLRARQAILLEPQRPAWKYIPFFTKSEILSQGWMGVPFHVGKRLIAVLALWRETPFTASEKTKIETLARNLASVLEAGLLFEEMAGYLHRLALLNDFVLTISATQSLEQIIRRTFALLERSFKPDQVALLLKGNDLLREYRPRDSQLEMRISPMASHPFAEYLTARRRSNILDGGEEEIRSTLYSHLRHRGQTIGLIVLQSRSPKAFTSHDEQLLGVLGSHLASLIEYSRLREEAEARARRLGLIHDVVEQILGLSDLQEILQIVADLLVEYFAYEFAEVTLFDEFPMSGRAGKRPEILAAAQEWTIQHGLIEQARKEGQSLLFNALAQEPPESPRSWQPTSALIVLLRDGAQVIGALQAASSHPNTFDEIDRVALESLAGILTTVARNVRQYTSLQNTIQELRATQSELKRQMEIQRLTERRLIQAAKLAAVGEMAAGVAHELNNPLTTVVGFSELALEEIPKDSPLYADLEMVLREARRAREVVRRLLDFARPGEITRTRYDFNQIVQDVVSLVRHLLHTSGIQHTLQLEDNLPWVYVSVNQIKQVLLNLIHNAIQAMPLGGELTIITQRAERENRSWIVCHIKDTGIGILPEDRKHLFEPFFTTKAKQGGTGLGLSISYNIIADHGGTIEVESEHQRGSCFSIWLPI